MVSSTACVLTPEQLDGTKVLQEQSLPHLRHRYRAMSVVPLSSLRTACEELEEVRRRYLLRPAQPQVGHRCIARGAKEPLPRLHVQKQLHSDAKKAESVLLV